MRTSRITMGVALAVALIVLGSMFIASRIGGTATDANAAENGVPPIPAETLKRLSHWGTNLTVDEKATETEREAADKAIAVAVDSMSMLSKDQVAYASVGDATVQGSPELREPFRAWVVILEEVEIPKMGIPDEKPVPQDFYVVVDAETMDAEYGGTLNEDDV